MDWLEERLHWHEASEEELEEENRLYLEWLEEN